MSIKIASITTTRLNIPFVQSIRMSFGEVRLQTTVLVRLRDNDGAEGIGEASLMGGPHWGGESAESVEATIANYIAPQIVNRDIEGVETLAFLLSQLVKGNPAARGAVEMAALDLLGKRHKQPTSAFFGGAVRPDIPLAWTLSTGATATDIEEGERALGERSHRLFKLKIGRGDPAVEIARVCAIVEAFRGRADVIADINQAWDEATAQRWLPALQDNGFHGIEQPMAADNIAGAARLQALLRFPIIADEALTSIQRAFHVAEAAAARVFSIKPNRDGGFAATKKLAAVAEAAGIACYGGTMVETSVGTAACAHLYATVPNLQFGCELFGPQRLTHDIVQRPLTVKDGKLVLPHGHGHGITLDEERIAFLKSQQ